MKRRIAIRIIFVLLVIIGLWGILAHRVRLETWIWHLRHGTAVSFGTYIVPVPRNWHVEDIGSGLLLARLDTADKKELQKAKSHAVISLWSGTPPKDLDRFLSVQAKFSKLGNEQRLFTFPGGRIACTGGGKPLADVLAPGPDGWSCLSADGLTLIIAASTPDMQQVWEIVSGIRKKT